MHSNMEDLDMVERDANLVGIKEKFSQYFLQVSTHELRILLKR